jgi:hypothetical protein
MRENQATDRPKLWRRVTIVVVPIAFAIFLIEPLGDMVTHIAKRALDAVHGLLPAAWRWVPVAVVGVLGVGLSFS